MIPYLDKLPIIHQSCFIAPGAYIIGDVELDEGVSIWFNSVLRGDESEIRIGKNTNIQDLVVIHTDKDYPMHVGSYCTIGHHVILHGATIGNNSLIGMNSTILNNVKIGNNCMIGANSLLTSNTVIPNNSLAFGNPAKVIRELTPVEIAEIQKNAQHYVFLASTYNQ